MKPFSITLFVIATAFFSINAQNSEPLERIRAQKVAFITEKLGLNAAAAQKFWPVYNEFAAKKDSLNHLKKEKRKELKDKWDSLNSKQKEAAVDKQMQYRWNETKLEQVYHEKFKKILTIDQVMKLYEAELEFKLRLIKQIRRPRAWIDQNNDKEVI